jgi:hypothetical protein
VSDRLPSGIVVSALLRRVNDAGGMGVVRARGNAQAGAILVIALEQGANPRVYERGIDASGTTALLRSGPEGDDSDAIDAYWRRRRSRDPDLWVIELDIPFAERFAAETIIGG